MLRGKYTGLRAVERKDLARLLEWRNMPEYRMYFREYRELGWDNQERWFESNVLSDEHTRMFSIVKPDNGELIGACGLCYIDWVNQCADFSIYVGKGNVYIDDFYAIDAAKVLMSYGFDELNLYRLWCEIYGIDEKKKQMLENLGLRMRQHTSPRTGQKENG